MASKNWKNNIATTVTKITAYTLSGVIAILFISKLPGEYLNFHLNFYGLLSLVSFVVNIGLITVINRLRSSTQELLWYKFFVLGVAIWGFTEGLSRMATTPKAAIFWDSFGALGWTSVGVFFFMYTLYYTKQEAWLGKLSNQLALYLPTLLLLGLGLATDLVLSHDPTQTTTNPWGFDSGNGPLFIYLLAWLEVLFISSLVLLINYYRKTTSPDRKKQIFISIIAVSIPLVGGTLTDGIFPLLDIHGILPLTIVLSTVQAAIIAYARYRYKLFVVNALTLAPNILNGMNEMVLIVGKDQVIEYANPRAEHTLGYAEGTLAGHSLKEFMSQQELDHLQHAATNPEGGGLPGKMFTKQHRELSVLVSVRQVEADKHSESGIILVLSDISQISAVEQQNEQLENTKKAMLNALEDAQHLEQQLRMQKNTIEQTVKERTTQLSAEQARLTASINSLRLGFVITDDISRVVTINPTALRILGIPKAEELGDIEKVLDPFVNLKEQINKCIRGQAPVELDKIGFGSRFLHIFVAPIIEENKVIGVVLLLEDITDEIATERSKDEFFSIASHELRTPLTSIRGNTGLIKEYYIDQIKDPELKEMINDIHESSVRLIEIVNDFLDSSRLEQGRMEFKSKAFDLAQLANDSIKEFQPTLKQKNLYLRVESEPALPPVLADPDRVKQAIINLVGNAFKFTEQGGVVITIKHIGSFIKAFVSDSGKGIPLESQHLLFRKFQQASDSILTRDATRGTGLGLYITKLMIEGMGGKVSLEGSVEGKGTTFSFTLPVAPAEAIAATSQETPVKKEEVIIPEVPK